MRRMWRLSLALIIAGPGPAAAQVSAPVQIRLAAPVAPVTGPVGAGSAVTPGLTPFVPSLSAPSLSA
ncbi:MAG: hypothetical protein Q8T11_13830, partial [Elusimicrobiota bacterium]|nr:hypothetical protein [Elusimicrobiota bacterium]